MRLYRTILCAIILSMCLILAGCAANPQPTGGLGILLTIDNGMQTQVNAARLQLSNGSLRIENQPLYSHYSDVDVQGVRGWTGERGVLPLDAGLLMDYPPPKRLTLSSLSPYALTGLDTAAFPVPEGGLMLYDWALTPPGLWLKPYLAAAPGGTPVEVGRGVRPLALSQNQGIWQVAYLLQTQGEQLRWGVSLWSAQGDQPPQTRTVLLPDFSPEVMPVPAVWLGDTLYLYGKQGIYKLGSQDEKLQLLGQPLEQLSAYSPLLGQYQPLPGARMGAWGGTLVVTLQLSRKGTDQPAAQAALLLGADQPRSVVLHRYDQQDLTVLAANGRLLGASDLPQHTTAVTFPGN